jgi:hypothetical protein
MNLETEVKTAVEVFIKMKRSICEHEGGPQDLAPMLHFKYQHLNAYCGGLLAGNEHPLNMAPMAWRKVLDDGIPEFVMLMIEGYASTSKPGEDYVRGNMEKDFKDNPESNVREAITLQAIEIKTGKQFTAVVLYKYDDSGLPEFEEPNIGPCEGEALNSNVARMFSACRDATINFLKEAA